MRHREREKKMSQERQINIDLYGMDIGRADTTPKVS